MVLLDCDVPASEGDSRDQCVMSRCHLRAECDVYCAVNHLYGVIRCRVWTPWTCLSCHIMSCHIMSCQACLFSLQLLKYASNCHTIIALSPPPLPSFLFNPLLLSRHLPPSVCTVCGTWVYPLIGSIPQGGQ